MMGGGRGGSVSGDEKLPYPVIYMLRILCYINSSPFIANHFFACKAQVKTEWYLIGRSSLFQIWTSFGQILITLVCHSLLVFVSSETFNWSNVVRPKSISRKILYQNWKPSKSGKCCFKSEKPLSGEVLLKTFEILIISECWKFWANTVDL